MISFGIIGTGWITRDYVLAAHATGKWNLAAVYSRKEQTAQDFAAQFPEHKDSINIHTSLEALVSDPSISTLYIASPNILHHTQAKQALQAGKHVILEKPSCSTSEELDDLFTTAKAHNAILIEAFRHTQEPNFKLLKKNLARLGPIYGASFTFAQFSSRFDKVLAGETPGVFDLSMGGGALVDLGVYCIAAAVDLFGAPKKAMYFPVKIATGADGAGTVILQYEGFNVTCAHSKMFAGAAPSEVYGRDGTLSIPSITDITDVVLADPRKKTRGSVEGVSVPKELNLQDEAEEFARCILEGDSGKIGEYEAHSRAVLQVLESCRRENGLLFEGAK